MSAPPSPGRACRLIQQPQRPVHRLGARGADVGRDHLPIGVEGLLCATAQLIHPTREQLIVRQVFLAEIGDFDAVEEPFGHGRIVGLDAGPYRREVEVVSRPFRIV
jgi:hypothetical protein